MDVLGDLGQRKSDLRMKGLSTVRSTHSTRHQSLGHVRQPIVGHVGPREATGIHVAFVPPDPAPSSLTLSPRKKWPRHDARRLSSLYAHSTSSSSGSRILPLLHLFFATYSLEMVHAPVD